MYVKCQPPFWVSNLFLFPHNVNWILAYHIPFQFSSHVSISFSLSYSFWSSRQSSFILSCDHFQQLFIMQNHSSIDISSMSERTHNSEWLIKTKAGDSLMRDSPSWKGLRIILIESKKNIQQGAENSFLDFAW